jgi:hypothetical protein
MSLYSNIHIVFYTHILARSILLPTTILIILVLVEYLLSSLIHVSKHVNESRFETS